MIKFKKSAIDNEIAKSGKFIECHDADNTSLGKFKMRYLDFTAPAFTLAVSNRNKRMTKPELARLSRPQNEADIVFGNTKEIELIFSSYLVDWDVYDADDKAIPFNLENAVEYFAHYRGVYNTIMEFAQSAETFLSVTKDDVIKNS